MNDKRSIKICAVVLLFVSLVLIAQPAFAQSGTYAAAIIVKAQVLDVAAQQEGNLPGLDIQAHYQTLTVQILEGNQKDKIITVENDYIPLSRGDVFYLEYAPDDKGGSIYSVGDPYRLPTLALLAGLFVICVLLLGGKPGIRGLVSLACSFFFIMYLLLPGILHGYSPIAVSIGVSSLIIVIGSYITHGFNKTTTSAVIGMIITVVLTGALAYYAMQWAHLSGNNTEEAMYLQSGKNAIDLKGLLFGGIMIGLLGVLYDVAIGQAISVEELNMAGAHLSRKTIYQRALRIGREHIGALVNTLAIAYVGASLPLLLLFYQTANGAAFTINQEVLATEIVRTIIGSIGLMLAVPITTLLSVFLLVKRTS